MPFASHTRSNQLGDIAVMATVPYEIVHKRLVHAGEPNMRANIDVLNTDTEMRPSDFHCEIQENDFTNSSS